MPHGQGWASEEDIVFHSESDLMPLASKDRTRLLLFEGTSFKNEINTSELWIF